MLAMCSVLSKVQFHRGAILLLIWIAELPLRLNPVAWGMQQLCDLGRAMVTLNKGLRTN